MKFEPSEDENRRKASFLDWTVYQGECSLLTGEQGYTPVTDSPLRGAFGQVMRRVIEGRFSAGYQRPIMDPNTGRDTGLRAYPARWTMLQQSLDTSVHLSQSLAGKDGIGLCAPLYRDPIRVDVQSTTFAELRKMVGLDAALIHKQSLSVACGSSGVGVIISDDDTPPGLKAFAPHEVTFIPAPWNPLLAQVAVTYHDGYVLVSDLRDPLNPRFGRWYDIESWASGYGHPLMLLEGAFYPFRFGGKPMLHVIPCSTQIAPTCLQPGAESLRQKTIDTILRYSWVSYVSHLGSFNRALILSQGSSPPEGAEQLASDPAAISALWGTNAPEMQIIPHSMDAVEKLYSIARQRLQTLLSQIEGDLRVRDGKQGVQSGVAIELERAGAEANAAMQKRLQVSTDIQIVQLLIGTWNWLVVNSMLNPLLVPFPLATIPETDVGITYPFSMQLSDRLELAKEKEATGDYVTAYLLREGGDPTDQNQRAAAFSILSDRGRERIALTALGYGVDAATLYAQGQTITAAPEVTYTPPASVAQNAATGLRLRKEFGGRWGGLTVAPLLKRATSLQNRTPMPEGEVRSLQNWLDAHVADAEIGSAGEGTWNDLTDPSGEWIAYLSQGGDAGRAWCAEVLAG